MDLNLVSLNLELHPLENCVLILNVELGRLCPFSAPRGHTFSTCPPKFPPRVFHGQIFTPDKHKVSAPKGPTEYRKLPKTTEYYRKQPNTTENNQILPKTTEYYRKLIYPKYRKLPKTTQCWFFLMLECTEKYQSTLI